MAIRDIFKFSRKTFVNPSGWLDYEGLKAHNQTIWSILKPLFARPTVEREETFEQAMQRLNLTEEDVKNGASNYRLYALILALAGLLVFFYSFYLLFRHSAFFAWILGFSAAALFFAQAFKYDFWSLQMRRRKLGITFEEWKKSILGDKGTST